MDHDMPMPMSPPNANSTMNMKDMAMMHMSFYWGKNVTVLFQGWPDYNNLGMYILSLVFVFVISAIVELMSSFPPTTVIKPHTHPAVAGMIQSVVYAVRMALAYMVMLSVMSFNVGVFIVAVAGHTLGFFIVKYRALSSVLSGAESNGTDHSPKV